MYSSKRGTSTYRGRDGQIHGRREHIHGAERSRGADCFDKEVSSLFPFQLDLGGVLSYVIFPFV